MESSDQIRAGGHDEFFQFLPDGTLLKAGKKREIDFFVQLSDPSSKYYTENLLLKPFIPEFHGIVEQGKRQWIKMRNVNHGLSNVSFMDIKMGDRSYDEEADAVKQARQREKDERSTTAKHGFRIVGVVIKDNKGNVIANLAKKCNDLSIDKVPDQIKEFLKCNEREDINMEAAVYYLEKLKEIRGILLRSSTRGVIGSSIFFALSNTDNKYDMKLIDFAHVFPLPEGQRDTGYLKGLEALIEIFEGIVAPERRLGKSKGEGMGDDKLAGGHADSFRFLPDGILMKAGKKGEIEFFEEFSKSDGKYYLEMLLLRPYIPELYGIALEDGRQWIKMRNVNHGLSNVSFMDIKMGDKSYSPDDPPEKVKNQIERAKMTTSFEYGFRITGVTVRDDKGNIEYKLIKQYGQITIKTVVDIIKKFMMCNGRADVNREAIEYYVRKMKEILSLIESKITRCMIASSLFFVLSNTDNKFELKIIDFAHVFPMKEGEKDTGYIKGLKNLISIFEQL
eukprot:TRINITY_DN5024_c0_g1_i18.p1 TRINITY_DN5024_c0_g1~~TRINITY_DN5024_c0_g1_i18.p1  ORF type:complete len:507 (-),score=150.78 TRINITY_DN5024_c0_g1_i18:149-1669(-)